MEEARRIELILLMDSARNGGRDSQKHEAVFNELLDWWIKIGLKSVNANLNGRIISWPIFSRDGLKHTQKQYIDSMLALIPNVKDDAIDAFVQTLKTVSRFMPDPYNYEIIPTHKVDEVDAEHKSIQARTSEEIAYMLELRDLHI